MRDLRDLMTFVIFGMLLGIAVIELVALEARVYPP